MNGKQKIIAMFAVLWILVFVGYIYANPDSLTMPQASQYNSGGFTAISHLATGYFNDSSKQLAHMPKFLP